MKKNYLSPVIDIVEINAVDIRECESFSVNLIFKYN